MKCSQCSQEILEVSSFCPHCGSPVAKPPVIVAAPPEPLPLVTNGVTVCPNGEGDFLTIHAAIQASKPGAEIIIKAGRYQEVLIIDKPVTLTGEAGAQVFLEHEEFPVLRITNTQVILRNLVLGVTRSPNGSILITDSDVQITGCLIADPWTQESPIPLSQLMDQYRDISSLTAPFYLHRSSFKGNQLIVQGKASRIAILDSCLVNVNAQVREEGHLILVSTITLRSTIHATSRASLEASKCNFLLHNDNQGAAVVLEDCEAKVQDCHFSHFYKGVIIARSKAGIINCKFLGTKQEVPATEEDEKMFRNHCLYSESGSRWYCGDAVMIAEACGDDVFIMDSTFSLCRIGVALGQLTGFTSTNSHALEVKHITQCEFNGNYIGIRVRTEVYQPVAALSSFIYGCKFNHNEVRAVLVTAHTRMEAIPGRIRVEHCLFNGNKEIAVEFSGNPPKNNDSDDAVLYNCAFSGNHVNLRSSMRFELSAVRDCTGLGENALVAGNQSLRHFMRDSELGWILSILLTFVLPFFGMLGVGVCVSIFNGGIFSNFNFAGGLALGLASSVLSFWVSSVSGLARATNMTWMVWVFAIIVMGFVLMRNTEPSGPWQAVLTFTLGIGYVLAQTSYEIGKKALQPTS